MEPIPDLQVIYASVALSIVGLLALAAVMVLEAWGGRKRP